MMLRKTCALFAAGMLAAPALADPSAPQPTPSPSATASAATRSVLPPPPPGKGQVVFFRPARLWNVTVWYNVRENGAVLGKLTNGAYIVQTVDPGPHAFTAATENRNTLHLEVDDGETYYIQGLVQMGLLVGEPELAPSDQATFERAVKHMHLVHPPVMITFVDRVSPK